MALTIGQAIGVGVAVGFAGSLILIAVILGISRIISAYYVPPSRAIAMQPQYSPAVLIPPPDAIEELNIGVRQLSAPCELKQAENLAYHIEAFAEFFFGHRWKPDVPESLFNESELVHLAGEPINGGTWSQSISNVSTRVPTIRCFLAQVLLKRMQPTCPVDDCLLPPEISSCYQLVCQVYDIPRRMRPIAAWRQSILMLQDYPWSLLPVACRPFKEGDPRKERMQAMAPVIISVLQPEALRTDHPRDDRFEKLLVDILERAANSAIVLLGQPTEWEAVWSSTKTGFIVHPGLRFVWQGKTKYSRPAVVDDELTWPIRPDDQGQPNSQSEEQPKSDAAQAPTHDSLQLCEPKTAEHSTAKHKTAKDGTAELGTAELTTAAYSTTDY
ncbi:hypothetical protein LCI18_013047 [Fusarium solani-melongenae]|uniref:Uncharacterized protein n=1 Tax=Fusarium solani subsp. cucurbitae TaxID=2747967 RepID=A0ACD3ZLY8_FUSSC|nr:hypothetical protein LCI18_013047 [Fusarium solani-melongenae]